jgi:hypothetical protein
MVTTKLYKLREPKLTREAIIQIHQQLHLCSGEEVQLHLSQLALLSKGQRERDQAQLKLPMLILQILKATSTAFNRNHHSWWCEEQQILLLNHVTRRSYNKKDPKENIPMLSVYDELKKRIFQYHHRPKSISWRNADYSRKSIVK